MYVCDCIKFTRVKQELVVRGLDMPSRIFLPRETNVVTLILLLSLIVSSEKGSNLKGKRREKILFLL